jgi:Lipocalin-like domain
MTNKFLGFALLFALIFTSCKDSGPATLTETLAANPWKITASNYDEDGPGPIVSVNNLDDCEKDNTFVFKSDKTVTINAGAIKCNPSDAATESATWVLSADEKTLTLVPSALPIQLVYTVLSFTETEIKVSYPDLFGGVGTTNATWSK